MRRHVCALALGVFAAAGLSRVLLAQSSVASPAPPLAFEVASIRLLDDRAEGPVAVSLAPNPGNRFTSDSSVRVLIQQAYQMPFVRQIGGPAWTREDNYHIDATIPEAVTRTPENVRLMVRALLEDRFKLVAREELREMPIYALVPARTDGRLGPKLQPSNCPPPVRGVPPPVPPNVAGVAWDFGPKCGTISSRPGLAMIGGFPIARFVDLLQSIVGRTVTDRSGLAGTYVAEVSFAAQPMSAQTDSDRASLFTAIQEQLGLKLVAERAPVQVLVIDSIERPTPN